MRILILVCFTLLAFPKGHSQGIDLDEIKKLTSDPSSPYFYDSLLKEFLMRPYDLEMTKGINLYYGKLFSKYYEPYKIDANGTNFNELLMRENYERAIAIGEKMLEKDPVNFAHLLKMLRCYVATRNEELAQLTKMQTDVLYKAILHSGDGESSETAWRVTDISDEYALMAIMNIEGISRRSKMKPSSVIDTWKVRSLGKGGQNALYFELLLNKDAFQER